MQFDQLRWRQFITLRSIGRAFLFGIFLTFTGQGSVQGRQSEAKITLLPSGAGEGHSASSASCRIAAAIKSKLGTSFLAFERIDEQSHRAAGRLATRAMAKDVSRVAKAFGRLAESCVSCHKQFRATLRNLSD
jgi:hypothetical protein